MEIALFLFIVPVLWIIFAKLYFKTYSFKEACIQFGASFLLCFILGMAAIASKGFAAMDTHILNGEVVSKKSRHVSCEHSYQICTTVSNGNGGTRQQCQTHYEHSYDVDWVVKTTVGDIRIRRVDRRGLKEPARFSEVEIGEPASLEKSYQNYVKAVPESVFNMEKFEELSLAYEAIPYPSVYDYYRINHIINTSTDIDDQTIKSFNDIISSRLKSMGEAKQVNVIFVLTDNISPDYATGLEYDWLKGKKNDMVVVIGINNDLNVEWSKSFGWSENNRVFLELDSFIASKALNQDTIEGVMDIIDKFYERESFEKYKYLMDEVSPPLWSVIIAFLVNIIFTIGLGIYFVNNDTRRSNRFF